MATVAVAVSIAPLAAWSPAAELPVAEAASAVVGVVAHHLAVGEALSAQVAWDRVVVAAPGHRACEGGPRFAAADWK